MPAAQERRQGRCPPATERVQHGIVRFGQALDPVLGKALGEHREVWAERVEPVPHHIVKFPLRCRSRAALSQVRQLLKTSLDTSWPYWTSRHRSSSKPPSPTWLSQSLLSTRCGTMYTRT